MKKQHKYTARKWDKIVEKMWDRHGYYGSNYKKRIKPCNYT